MTLAVRQRCWTDIYSIYARSPRRSGRRRILIADEPRSPTRHARPFYRAVGNEEAVFTAAYRQGLALVLKGPTGCGKTRFVEAMAHDLDRP